MMRDVDPSLTQDATLLRALMDHLPDNIYFKDAQSRFVAINRSMAHWLGLSDPSEATGKSDYDFFTEEHAKAAFIEEQRLVAGGEPMMDVEEKETWPDGTTTWVSTTKVAMRNAKGEVIGTFGLSRDITERKRVQDQLAKFAAELRARNDALERDLELARELQASMLPQRFPVFLANNGVRESAVRFHHFYSPSMAVSGDFFDVVEVSEDAAGIFICDVMGHGVRAAMIAAIVRRLLTELKPLWTKPAALLREMNLALHATFDHGDVPIFVSAFYAVLNVTDGTLRYANAGHPCPLRVHQNSHGKETDKLPISKSGPVLGLFPEAEYREQVCGLQENDVILLFTDGLFEVEGQSGQSFDYTRLVRTVGQRSDLPAIDLCQRVIEEVQQFSGRQQFDDDVCLIAVEVSHLLK